MAISNAAITPISGTDIFLCGAVSIPISNFTSTGSTTITATIKPPFTTSHFALTSGTGITISGASGTEQLKLNGDWIVNSVSNDGTTFTFVVTSTVVADTYTTTLGKTIKYSLQDIQEYAVTCMMFCNASDTDTSLTVHAVPYGSAIGEFTTQIIKDLLIPAGETFSFDTEKLVLSTGDKIYAKTDVDGVVATISSMRVS